MNAMQTNDADKNADNVRETLARLREWRGWYANGEAPSPSEWAEFDRRLAAVDAQATTCRICKHGRDAHSRRLASNRRGFETVRACADCACVEFVQEVSPRGTVTDDYEAGYGEGFHHGRSTPTEHPITDAEVEAAAYAICMAAESESLSDVRTNMREQYMREARAALEAAREARP